MSDPSISSISLRSAGQKRRLNYNDNHVAPHLKQIYKKKKKDTDKPYFCKTSILKEGEVVERPINDPEQIVFWRWKKTSSKKRQLFIKWKKLSYWKCTWVPEKVIEYHFPQLHTFYFRDNDSEVPPDLEESPNRHHHADNDPYDLHERFYQFGVKPEWLQIHRIMSHDACENDEFDYLVKWREVPHSKATWERDDADIANYEEAIMKYWIHREKNTNEKPPDKIQNMIAQHLKRLGLSLKSEKLRIPKADLQIKYETQPGYIFESVGTLHPYQLEGISWLRNCYSNGTDAILADEMGLGKTIQALTFLYSLMKEGHCEGPFLIVAPLSTILNWEREAEKWCPDFYVVTYVGDQDSRMVLRDYEFSYTPAAIRHGKGVAKMRNVKRKFDVVLTSYEIVNMDKCLLSSIAWDALVVDEAHRLKNDDALLFKTLNKYTIDYRVLLTGTPLQNNLKELFHLLNFLSPDRFDQLEEFLEEFSDISKEEQIEKLHNLLEPHMLRRLKADVFTGIPPKTELIVRVELSALQKEMYKNIFTKNVAALASTTGLKFTAMQHLYMQLRKCCNHPYIFDTASLEAPKDEAGNYEGTALIKNAGKFVLLQKMLRKLKAQGHRVLIFSQMTKLLDILEDFCDYEGYEYERIDGSITGQMRQDAIDRFNAPGAQQFVFLLSTRAGGLGINLATADTVIIYDSDWNPHNDIQALSRAHRIGQTKKVMIYRYVTKGSVEEQMIAAAKRKMLLNHLVVETGVGGREGKNGAGMSKTELEEALKWGAEKLFKEDEEDGEGRRKKKSATVWTDDAIDSLLNRDREEEPAREGDRQEYMSSFKVADYNPKNAMEDDEEDDDDDERPDPNYWQNMLKARMENLKKEEEPEEENGKRIRKQINYDEDVEDEWDVKDETENQDASSHDSGSN